MGLDQRLRARENEVVVTDEVRESRMRWRNKERRSLKFIEHGIFSSSVGGNEGT